MNRIYLTCRHHPTQAESFLLASREAMQPFEANILVNKLAPQPERHFATLLQKFLKTHATCGGGFDHFTVSYAQAKDGDLPKSDPVADAVHATLRVVK